MRIALRFIIAAAALGLASPAWSIMITGGSFDGTDVGSADIYAAEIAGMSSGDQTEVDWANGELGTSFVKDDLAKNEDVSWYETSETDVIAFGLSTGPGHYVVKNARLHVLFSNVASLDWGVIDLNQISGDLNLGDDFQISHVGELGNGKVTVPEPGTLGLLAAGLLGIGLLNRRRRIAR